MELPGFARLCGHELEGLRPPREGSRACKDGDVARASPCEKEMERARERAVEREREKKKRGQGILGVVTSDNSSVFRPFKVGQKHRQDRKPESKQQCLPHATHRRD